MLVKLSDGDYVSNEGITSINVLHRENGEPYYSVWYDGENKVVLGKEHFEELIVWCRVVNDAVGESVMREFAEDMEGKI